MHLENEQYVTFNSTDNNSLWCAHWPCDTKLTAYFKANRCYPAARTLLYAEFPSKFTWHPKEEEWRPRERRTAYGRLSFIPPNAGEKYYARLILSMVKDLRGFDDLRTFEGVLYCYGHYNHTPDLGKCVMWWNAWDLARHTILDAMVLDRNVTWLTKHKDTLDTSTRCEDTWLPL